MFTSVMKRTENENDVGRCTIAHQIDLIRVHRHSDIDVIEFAENELALAATLSSRHHRLTTQLLLLLLLLLLLQNFLLHSLLLHQLFPSKVFASASVIPDIRIC